MSKQMSADEVRKGIQAGKGLEMIDDSGLKRFSATDQQWIRNELAKVVKAQQRGYESQIRQRDEKIAELSEDLKRAARAAEK